MAIILVRFFLELRPTNFAEASFHECRNCSNNGDHSDQVGEYRKKTIEQPPENGEEFQDTLACRLTSARDNPKVDAAQTFGEPLP